MPRVDYTGKQITGDRLALVEHANKIIAEYRAQGFVLTLRQLYYQFVARALIENSFRSYKRMGDLVSTARLAGYIDWNAIEDRTRNLQRLSHWGSPREIVDAAASSFNLDKWADQEYRVEVWIEKEALVGVIEGVCDELDVPFFACKGYVSQSEQWRAGQRFARYSDDGQQPVVIHLGDHDPSGIDMTRDNRDRLRLFDASDVVVKRIALNMDQIEKYDPPPYYAKTGDSRFGNYVAEFGTDSWELDALEPKVLADLIEHAVFGYRDADKWAEMVEQEQEHRDAIAEVAETLD